jgi:hypothetical protein
MKAAFLFCFSSLLWHFCFVKVVGFFKQGNGVVRICIIQVDLEERPKEMMSKD